MPEVHLAAGAQQVALTFLFVDAEDAVSATGATWRRTAASCTDFSMPRNIPTRRFVACDVNTI